jgi:hypothetical protein
MDAISQLWWGDDENSKKMHSLAWWKLCYPKREGVMGFRDCHSFNLAMLAKQAWRLVTLHQILYVPVFFKPNTILMEIFSKQRRRKTPLLLGKVFWLA